MTACDRVQELVAEAGRAALERDQTAREHVDGCTYCQHVLAALAEIDAALPCLPGEDAPGAPIARVLASTACGPAPRPAGAFSGPRWASIAASVLVLVATGTLLWPQVRDREARAPDSLFSRASPWYLGDRGAHPGRASERERAPERLLDIYSMAGGAAPQARSLADDAVARAPVLDTPAPAAPTEGNQETTPGGYRQLDAPARLYADIPAAPGLEADGDGVAPAREQAPRPVPPAVLDEARPLVDAIRENDQLLGAAAAAGTGTGFVLPERSQIAKLDNGARDRKPALRGESRTERADRDASQSLLAPLSKRIAPPEEAPGAGDKVSRNEQAGAKRKKEQSGEELDDARAVARRYLGARQRLDGLEYLQASGYWSNTYVPGDARMRLLGMRLARWDRSQLPAALSRLRLERRARPNWQPFDPPVDAALAAYVQADRTAVAGPSRLRVQVGLRGAERGGGHRPAMNVGVVLDRRSALGPAALVRVRELLGALARARQPGDRFSLTVAGPDGGLRIAPEAFRHGPLTMALESLARAPAQTGKASVSLGSAIATAVEVVAATDDPAAPVGASVVLVVATAPFGTETQAIESQVHANAVAGIVTSAVAIGEAVHEGALERLVLLGQGRRSVLEDANDASRLVDRELYAASRAVARAVRLRIELAPGVRLVEVLGSRRLAEPEAGRVREAERSIDRRLARNLGIAADRGEDEAGVQIVIPHFYAGDAHVVLLDVVVEGPGPVAEVSVRYKDLVRLANGVTRASLALEPGVRALGPLERNVLKNELTQRLSERVRRASALLAAGDPAGAAVELERHRALIVGLRLEIADWQHDPELANDLALLDEYLAVLRSPAIAGPAARQVADSLADAAHRRLLAPRTRADTPAARRSQ